MSKPNSKRTNNTARLMPSSDFKFNESRVRYPV